MTRQITRYPLNLAALDDVARDGSYQLVSDGQQFTCARWDGAAFVFPDKSPIQFVADRYYIPGHSIPGQPA